MVNAERSELFGHLLLEEGHTLHEIRVLLTQPDVFLLEQPPGQTAHFPFGTDVRSGAHNDIHAVLLRQSAEGNHVVVAGEVEHPFALFVDVPEHIKAKRVHAQRLAHADAVLPIGARNARVMHFGSLDDKRFAVEQEGALACRE